MKRLLALLMLLALPARAAELAPGQVLRGTFVQERHLQGFAQPLKSQGSFVVVLGRGLIWRAETPFAITTVLSPAGLVQSVNGTVTTRLDATRIPFMSRLYHMMAGALSGDWRGLEAGFAISRAAQTLTLVPKDEATAGQIKALTLEVGRFVDAVTIQKPNGDWDHLTFLDQSLDQGPPAPSEAALLP
jgi:hypothetical protein